MPTSLSAARLQRRCGLIYDGNVFDEHRKFLPQIESDPNFVLARTFESPQFVFQMRFFRLQDFRRIIISEGFPNHHLTPPEILKKKKRIWNT
jgi:hypothetical protein